MLFGIIASSGLRMLVQSGVDYGNNRNLIISSVILVLGIGGGAVSIGSFTLQGMSLAAIVGVLLNLILPGSDGAGEEERVVEEEGAFRKAGTKSCGG